MEKRNVKLLGPRKPIKLLGHAVLFPNAKRITQKHLQNFKPYESGFEIPKSGKWNHLLLPAGAVKSNNRVLRIEHAGHIFETPRITEDGNALFVLKDPVRKERVLVLRKTGGAQNPYGGYSLNTIWNGQETTIGLVSFRPELIRPNVSSLAISERVRRKNTSLSPQDRKTLKNSAEPGEIEEIKKIRKKMAGEKRGSQRFDDLTDWLWMDKETLARIDKRLEESKTKTYNYRHNKLSFVLLDAVESAARRTGIGELGAMLRTDTTARYLPKRGWVEVHKWPEVIPKQSLAYRKNGIGTETHEYIMHKKKLRD
ncbi:MAG: hypothetical protein V1676_02920 [Candidatus Diapherotrites archaeon]